MLKITKDGSKKVTGDGKFKVKNIYDSSYSSSYSPNNGWIYIGSQNISILSVFDSVMLGEMRLEVKPNSSITLRGQRDETSQWTPFIELSLVSTFSNSRVVQYNRTFDILTQLSPNKENYVFRETVDFHGIDHSPIFDQNDDGNTILKENTIYYARILYVTESPVKNIIMSNTTSFITPNRPIISSIPTPVFPEFASVNGQNYTFYISRTGEEYNAGQTITGYEIQLFDKNDAIFGNRITPFHVFEAVNEGQFTTISFSFDSGIDFNVEVRSAIIYKGFDPIDVVGDDGNIVETISEVGSSRFVIPLISGYIRLV